MPIPLVVHEGSWPYRPEVCPADADFIAWVQGHQFAYRTIFHMGPGGHHRVGIEAGRDAGNYVLALTCAPEEMAEYVRLASDDAALSGSYQCLFGDLNIFPLPLLPGFDIVTLFHLGEAEDARRETEEYGSLALVEIVYSFWGDLRPGGHLLFYTRSAAWGRVGPIVDETLGPPSFRFNSLVGYSR